MVRGWINLSRQGWKRGIVTCAVALMTGSGIFTSALAQTSEPMTIEANDFLEWNQSEGIYIAEGDAVAIQGSSEIRGNVLRASYDPDAEDRAIETVIATGNVYYKDEQSTARGQKLIYNIGDGNYQVDGPDASVAGARGTISADKVIMLETRDDNSQFLNANGKAVYRDSTGRVFAGDNLNAYFDAEGALQTLDAEGDVLVTTENGRQATGDAATYDAASENATLTGNVSIIDGGNRMNGGRAEVDFKTGNSRMLSDGSTKRVSGVLIAN